LGDLLSMLIDHRGRTPKKLGGDFVSDGIPVVSALNLKEGRLNLGSDVRYVTREMYDRWMPQRIQVGDVLLTSEAPLGEAAYVKEDIELCIGQRLYALRADSSQLDPRFLYYKLRTDSVRQRLQSRGTGTTAQGIRQSELVEIPIEVPPMRVQRTVVHVLGVIDDLIDNNRRRIEIIEEMARAIYREWFVHFGFPGHEEVEMVDSEMGEIPKGWSVKKLGSVCDVVVGQSPKSEHYNEDGEGLPFHQGVTDFGEVIPTHRVYCTEDKRVAKEGDILFSVRAPVGRINLADRNLIVGRGLHAIRHKQGKQAFILYQLKSIFFKEDIMGGGTIFQAVTKGDVLGLNLLIPPERTLDAFQGTVQPMVELMVNLVKQNHALSRTRDLLLPKLVSGEIDVSHLDIEESLANAQLTSKYKMQSTLDQWTDGDDQDAMGR